MSVDTIFPIFGILNELDVMLIIILFLTGILGMTRGAATQLVSMLSFWLALIIALWLYRPLSVNIIRGVFQTLDPNVSEMFAFAVLFVAFFHGIRLFLSYLINPPENEEQRRKEEAQRRKKREANDMDDPAIERYVLGPLNLLLGMALGVVLGMFWWAIIFGLLQFIFQGSYLSFAPKFLQSLGANIQSSYIVYNVLNPLLYLIFKSVSLFVPADATIVQFMLDTIINTRG